jgi:hypothetical protein
LVHEPSPSLDWFGACIQYCDSFYGCGLKKNGLRKIINYIYFFIKISRVYGIVIQPVFQIIFLFEKTSN